MVLIMMSPKHLHKGLLNESSKKAMLLASYSLALNVSSLFLGSWFSMPALPRVGGLHSDLPTVLNDKTSWSVVESPGAVPCPREVENRKARTSAQAFRILWWQFVTGPECLLLLQPPMCKVD